MNTTNTNHSERNSKMNDCDLTRDVDWHDYLREFIDELQHRRSALPTEQNIAEWTSAAVLRAMTECHHALSEVLRGIIDVNTRYLMPPELTVGVDSVLYQCIDANLDIDHVRTALLPLAGSAELMNQPVKMVQRSPGEVGYSFRGSLTQVPVREYVLSTTLNCLIGDLNVEMALLPDRKVIGEWFDEEVHGAVRRCQHALIAVLRCVVELQALDNLDIYSRLWISEAIEKCQLNHESLEFFQDVLQP